MRETGYIKHVDQEKKYLFNLGT